MRSLYVTTKDGKTYEFTSKNTEHIVHYNDEHNNQTVKRILSFNNVDFLLSNGRYPLPEDADTTIKNNYTRQIALKQEQIDDLKRRLDDHDRDILLLINSINLMVKKNPFLNVDAGFPGLCSDCGVPRKCFPRICSAMPSQVLNSLTNCSHRIPKVQP